MVGAVLAVLGVPAPPARAGEALTRLDAWAGAAHDLGLDEDFRGALDLGVDVDAWQADGWTLELGTEVETLVRENRIDESVVRVSPRRVVYGAIARIRLGDRWSLFVLHRSQHDVDSDDAAVNRETISYEIYGVQWRKDLLRIAGGVYYDRGTTVDGRAQTLPFDHYLAGVRADGLLPIAGPMYAAASLEVVAHRDAAHLPLGHVNTGGSVELGVRVRGPGAELRVGLGVRRVEDPLHLKQPALHMLLLTARAGRGLFVL